MGVTNKTPEYMAKHPLGQVPLMETPDGPLFESNTLVRYGTLSPCSFSHYYPSSPFLLLIDVHFSCFPLTLT